MQGEAGLWARPYLKQLAHGHAVFVDWAAFEAAFVAKFEPINASAEAKSVLQALKQGTRDFASYISEFETWAPRTGWTRPDLFDRLKSGLNDDYLVRLSYFTPPAANYDALCVQCHAINRSLQDLRHNKAAAAEKAPAKQSASTSAFKDPNAMDIDAARLDSLFVGCNDKDAVLKQHRKVMANHCRVCGSTAHKNMEGRHPANTVCKHCKKKGHWAMVCLNRLQGEPAKKPAQTVAAASVASTSKIEEIEDQSATIAALRDQLALQQKQMTELMELIKKNF